MKKMKETSGKIEEISGKIWENNVNEIPDKFWIKCLGNYDWIIPNKILIVQICWIFKKNSKNLRYS